MNMYNPLHPGEILRELYIEPLNLKDKDVAKGLGITPKALSNFLNCHVDLSIQMAFKLSKAFDTSPEFWLNLQNQYSIFHAHSKFSSDQVKSMIHKG